MERTTWKCGRHSVPLSRPVVMGIVNVTPDSFSDGGLHDGPVEALAHARGMISAGALIIDVGGESTRPGARPVETAEELARVRPVVAQLAADGAVPVSIDTRHAGVARACVDVGAAIINDVGGFRDPAMVEVAAGCEAGLVVMHMLGDDPRTMQDEPTYSDVVGEVIEFLGERCRALEAAGVRRERIVIDPGIGFGKSLAQNVELLRSIPRLRSAGYPVLVGASRKRFIGEILGEEEPLRRVSGSVGAAVAAYQRGADLLRVHDVAETVQALEVAAVIGR